MTSFLDMASEELLTTAQVARLVGRSRECVSLAARRGEVEHAMKLPGCNGAYLFTRAAVEAWRGARLFELDGHLVA